MTTLHLLLLLLREDHVVQKRNERKPCVVYLFFVSGHNQNCRKMRAGGIRTRPLLLVPLYSRVVEVIGSRVPREVKASTIGHNRRETTPDKGGGTITMRPNFNQRWNHISSRMILSNAMLQPHLLPQTNGVDPTRLISLLVEYVIRTWNKSMDKYRYVRVHWSNRMQSWMNYCFGSQNTKKPSDTNRKFESLFTGTLFPRRRVEISFRNGLFHFLISSRRKVSLFQHVRNATTRSGPFS